MEELKPTKFELTVIIRDPQSLLFRGIANSVSAINSKGLFDILGVHENFITIIKDKIIVRTDTEEKEFPVVQGILKVEENVVHIFLGTENI
jgi:F0F1-type ATP synthase epsilon subunit